MLNSTKKSKQICEIPTQPGKTTTTKKLFTFILLLSGMFSFSVADAQFICDCIPGQPAGYCYVDNHGNTKCQKIHIGHGGTWRVGQNESGMGIETSLQVNPNPVSKSTIISFSLGQSQKVSLKIFDINGRVVSTLADEIFEEEENKLVWTTESVNAGIYFLQFQSEENQERKKLVVTK